MRVVVVGASGNVGTAVLRRFAADATVTSVVGVARRVPEGGPYDSASWVACDITDPLAPAQLVKAFAGADSFVHLGWAVQPSHDRKYLHPVNVTGSRHVLDAA